MQHSFLECSFAKAYWRLININFSPDDDNFSVVSSSSVCK